MVLTSDAKVVRKQDVKAVEIFTFQVNSSKQGFFLEKKKEGIS